MVGRQGAVVGGFPTRLIKVIVISYISFHSRPSSHSLKLTKPLPPLTSQVSPIPPTSSFAWPILFTHLLHVRQRHNARLDIANLPHSTSQEASAAEQNHASIGFSWIWTSATLSLFYLFPLP